MLSLVLLFTIFLGLVGILALYGEWKRKRLSPSPKPPGDGGEVVAWMEREGCCVPTVDQFVAVFNQVATTRKVQPDDGSWSDLEITGLLPGTQPPSLTFSHVEEDSAASALKAVVDSEWPVCVPGVGVSIRMAGGQKVACHLQVDWMYMQFHLQLSATGDGAREAKGGRGLVMSLAHSTEPKMALSCLVVSEGVADSEAVASSVADVFYQLIGRLEVVREPLPPQTTPTSEAAVVPTVLVSAPQEELPSPTSTDSAPSLLAQPEGTEETPEGEGEVIEDKEQQDPPVSTDEQDVTTLLQPSKGEAVREDTEGTADGNADQLSDGQSEQLPLLSSSSSSSPTCWRRAPSYEHLEHISLPSIVESPPAPSSPLALPPPFLHSSYSSADIVRGRGRALTLSMSGDTFEETSSFGTEAEGTFSSTLVFEVNDSIHLRHIVAMSPAHAIKLRRRLSHAKKLHIYNDHTFVAIHLSRKQRAPCLVCLEKVSGVFGKQAYQCRDCHLAVHKACHHKVETQCPNSHVSSMKLIYPDSVSTASEV